MIHLNDEQLEQILAEEEASTAHLMSCESCRVRFAEKQAMAVRLRKAFYGIKAGDGLRDRIRTSVIVSDSSNKGRLRHEPSRFVILHKRLLSSVAAAAALVFFVVPGALYVSTNGHAQAAQIELSRMHEHNLSEGEDFVHTSDPNALEEHHSNHGGQHPLEEKLSDSLELYGCCVHTFRGRAVATYVVETEAGLVTVLTVTETPRNLGMRRMNEYSQPNMIIWGAICKNCNMAARRIGKTTHLAMGQVSHAVLTGVLTK